MGAIIGHLWLGDVGLAVVDLDDLPLYRRLDPSGMLGHLHQFPTQCRLAWEKVLGFDLPREYRRVDKVVILGMGGSAIGGDLVRRLALAESRVPVWVNRDYGLPPFVDGDTLVIASSYSGNTEETLSAFTAALQTPARKLAITAGGRLKKLAEKEGIPVFTIDYQAPPRAAFPHGFIPLLGIFQRLGLLGDKSADLEKALEVLNKLAGELVETTPLAANPAKRLAARLRGRLVVIYGGELLSEVARRWKTQLNENGKAWAFFELFPELNHNAVAGYDFPPEFKDKIFVVLLYSHLLSPRCRLHYEATAELLAKSGISHELVEAVGDTALAQVMGLVFLGDYVSFYLAMLNETDPTALAAVDFVKGYLARFKAGG
jgi:glucose/mannose-6-phosphate isomerase